MDRLFVSTRAGEFAVVGRRHAGAPRPTLVALVGAFPPKDDMHELVDWLPNANVLVAALPGFWGASFTGATIPELRVAFDELVQSLAADQPVITLGASTGCLVTLGLKSPNIRGQVAVEPFFSTAGLWPLIHEAHRLEGPPGGPNSEFFWTFFGMRGGKVIEDRNYRDLLAQIRTPTDVVLGGEPLGDRRELPIWPSFTAEGDRAALRACPGVTLHEGPAGTGHGLAHTPEGKTLIRKIVAAALDAVRR